MRLDREIRACPQPQRPRLQSQDVSAIFMSSVLSLQYTITTTVVVCRTLLLSFVCVASVLTFDFDCLFLSILRTCE